MLLGFWSQQKLASVTNNKLQALSTQEFQGQFGLTLWVTGGSGTGHLRQEDTLKEKTLILNFSCTG
jgi:adenylylsulfate kinase-like enzyme